MRDFSRDAPSRTQEKQALSDTTGLSVAQVANWFVNTRARGWRYGASADHDSGSERGEGGGSDGGAGEGGSRAASPASHAVFDLAGDGIADWNAPLPLAKLAADIARAWSSGVDLPAMPSDEGGGGGAPPAAPARPLVAASAPVYELAAALEGVVIAQRAHLRHWLALLGTPAGGRPEARLAQHTLLAEALLVREALLAKANARFTRALRGCPAGIALPGLETVRGAAPWGERRIRVLA